MKSILFYILVLSIPCTFIYFTSCGTEEISNTQATGDCGPSHNLHWGPNQTNTFVDDFNKRVYQFSAIPTSEITGICTKSKPTATGHCSWIDDTLRHLSVFLAVRWSAFGADDPGTIIPLIENFVAWDASYIVGLQQAYGEGPGNISDLRIDVKFSSSGSALEDSIFFAARSFGQHTLNFDYEDYVAPGVNLPVISTQHVFTENIIKGILPWKKSMGEQNYSPEFIFSKESVFQTSTE